MSAGWVDLTMPLGPDTPVYPGDPAVEAVPSAELDYDGYAVSVLRLNTHHGTHVDAPAHIVPGGQQLDEFPISRFIGRGVLLDLREGDEPSISHVQRGDVVLLHTGLSDDYGAPEYYEWSPGVSVELAAALAAIGVTLVGIDAGSIDAGGEGDAFPVHRLLLQSGVLVAENLVGLDSLVGRRFEVMALPLKLGLDGSPARVVARLLG